MSHANDTGNEQFEKMLIQMWQDEFARNDISLESDFFQLGGDSLQLMNLLFRISQDTGIELDPGTVFEGPTVVQLAAAIADRRRTQPTSSETVERAV